MVLDEILVILADFEKMLIFDHFSTKICPTLKRLQILFYSLSDSVRGCKMVLNCFPQLFSQLIEQNKAFPSVLTQKNVFWKGHKLRSVFLITILGLKSDQNHCSKLFLESRCSQLSNAPKISSIGQKLVI